MLWKAITGGSKVLRAFVRVGTRWSYHEVMLSDGSTRVEQRRSIVVLSMIGAAAGCVALALTADTSTGAGTIVGGLIALYVIYRRHFRRPY